MSAHHAPSSIKTKKALAEKLNDLNGKVFLEDPSLFNPRSLYAYELEVGETIIVTNHPKRSWFAQVTRTAPGTFNVK